MVSSYKKIFEKITKTEKKLRSTENSTSLSILEKYEDKKNLILRQDNEAVEEFRNLKENINTTSVNSYSLAYQPVTVKNQKWR